MQFVSSSIISSIVISFHIFITFVVDMFKNWFNNDYMVFNIDKIKFIANDIMDIS